MGHLVVGSGGAIAVQCDGGGISCLILSNVARREFPS